MKTRTSLPELQEAIRIVVMGFELGIFQRDTSNDGNLDWSMRLLPYVAALGKLQGYALLESLKSIVAEHDSLVMENDLLRSAQREKAELDVEHKVSLDVMRVRAVTQLERERAALIARTAVGDGASETERAIALSISDAILAEE